MELSLMVPHKHLQQLRITVFSNVMSCSLLYMMASHMKTFWQVIWKHFKWHRNWNCTVHGWRQNKPSAWVINIYCVKQNWQCRLHDNRTACKHGCSVARMQKGGTTSCNLFLG